MKWILNLPSDCRIALSYSIIANITKYFPPELWHTPGTSWPTLCDKCVGSLTSLADHNSEDAGDGNYGLSSLSEKTRTSNCYLQMSLQRQFILFSYSYIVKFALARFLEMVPGEGNFCSRKTESTWGINTFCDSRFHYILVTLLHFYLGLSHHRMSQWWFLFVWREKANIYMLLQIAVDWGQMWILTGVRQRLKGALSPGFSRFWSKLLWN